eukprot:TRINITY_DN716_c0_g1_i1.p1 TRINITY_DN716_c0_g1~~TRINITY_DN716_c0_g1_i1.p1  ORF type:complete len:385 (+),score=113.93 TRINITY_DN716_c0_g1_i1:71-1225(+)
MSHAAAQQYIEGLGGSQPQLSEQYAEIADLYKKKLWHQLTIKLEALVSLPQFRQGNDLINLYTNFVKDFELKINKLSLAKFTVAAANQYTDHRQALEFLQGISEKIKNLDPEANVLILSAIALLHLRVGDIKTCKEILETAETGINDLTGVDSAVYVAYYRARTEYSKAISSEVEFFKNAMLYLAYVPLEEIPKQQQVGLAFDLGIAALIGESIYNFGELLSHDVIHSLQGTPLSWMHDLLKIFNAGDLQGYEAVVAKNRDALAAQPALVTHHQRLTQKLSILALMELIFKRPAEFRTISFADISTATRLPVNEVEHLIMKSLSLGLMRGVIDEVDKTFAVSWVQSRTLDLAQVAVMRDSLDSWTKKVRTTLLFMEGETPELLA